MVDVIHSGYKVASAAVSFTGTQTLVSLTDNEYSDESDAIDNTSNLYLFCDLEWVSTADVTYVTPASIEVYMLPSVGGTNYADWDGNGTTDVEENNQYFKGSFILNPGAVAQRHTLRGIALPPGKFKFAVRNRSNVTLHTSGSALNWRPWQYASA